MRSRLAVVVTSSVILLTAAACSSDDNPTVTPNSLNASSAEGPTATSTATVARIITVAYANGKVTGDTRVTVDRGTPVRLAVTSDVADEVHNHATDQKEDITAGGTITMDFVANNPGQWEIELENLGKTLVELKING